jgi:hypothetical protein
MLSPDLVPENREVQHLQACSQLRWPRNVEAEYGYNRSNSSSSFLFREAVIEHRQILFCIESCKVCCEWVKVVVDMIDRWMIFFESCADEPFVLLLEEALSGYNVQARKKEQLKQIITEGGQKEIVDTETSGW